MSKVVDEFRRKKLLEYIYENYSLTKLLKDLGVWNGGGRVITCPFHPDSRPSFNIDEENNRFKCFSCGRGGGYASFYHDYYSIVIEDDKSFNQHMQDLLDNDGVMQKELGFDSIYVALESMISLEEQVLMKYQPHEYKIVDTKSIQRINRKLIKNGNIDLLLDFISDVERGLPIEELWNRYYLGIKEEVTLLTNEEKENVESDIDVLFESLMSEIEDSDTSNNDTTTSLFEDI